MNEIGLAAPLCAKRQNSSELDFKKKYASTLISNRQSVSFPASHPFRYAWCSPDTGLTFTFLLKFVKSSIVVIRVSSRKCVCPVASHPWFFSRVRRR
jgi:hypothetical protein